MMPNQNLQPHMLHPSARSRDRNILITGNNQGFANNLIWLKKRVQLVRFLYEYMK